jgi:LDH2 family malate/lactate/ureidoglycolate dehydrogenase
MTERVGNGLFLEVVDPAAFEEREVFLDRVEAYLAYIRASATQPGVERILLPGEPEARTSAERRARGIDIDDGTWSQLRDLAAALGVELE